MSKRVKQLPNGSTYKLSVVIPPYNEEDGIAEILDRTLGIQVAPEAVNVEGPDKDLRGLNWEARYG